MTVLRISAVRVLAATTFLIVCSIPLSQAKFSCYEGASEEESWLLAESCDDTLALDALMVECGAAKKTMFCEKFEDFAGDGTDVILVASVRDGNGCTGTPPAKKAFSAFHYGKKTSNIQCDGFFPLMNYKTPKICEAEIDALNSMVEDHKGDNFECALTTQTTTATSSVTTTVTTTFTTSGSTTATSTQSNSGTTTVTSTATSSVSSTATTSGSSTATTTASTSETTSGTTSASSSATTTQTTTVTTDSLLGPLECVIYKEGSANELKYLVQPKSGYSCKYNTRTLDQLLRKCDEIGLYPHVTVDATVVKCNKLPGMYQASFLADKTVADSSKKKECTLVPGLLEEMMKAFLAVGYHDARVENIMAADSFSCDQTTGTFIIKDKGKCDDFALIVGTALEQFRDGRFDRCARTTATSTGSSTASSSVTTTASTSITTTATSSPATSQSSTATTTQSNSQSTTITSTATTSASTTAVTTIFRHVESTCTATSTYGRVYVNDGEKCTDSSAMLTGALQLCEGNTVFGDSSSGKEKFGCIDKSSSSLQLMTLSNCAKSVVDLNAMMSEFRGKGQNSFGGTAAATFKCQLPFGLIKVKCDSNDLNDLNSLIDQYEDGRFRSCEFTTQTTSVTSSETSTETTSQTSTATSSFTTTATTTGTTFLPGRLSCAASVQGSITIYLIQGPPDTRTHDTTTEAERQSDHLDTILETCVSKLGQKKYTDSLSFKTVNDQLLMYSTKDGKCADTAKRMNAMVQEIRRAGGHQSKDDLGEVACTNDKTFYWLTKEGCDSEIVKYNAAITGYDTGEFNGCHLTTESTTVTSTQTTSATSTQSNTGETTVTTTATSTRSNSGTTTLTSTQTSSASSTVSSSVTTSGSTTATTSFTTTATTSMSSTASSSVSSTVTTSQSTSATSSVTSSATTSVSSTATTSASTSVSSTVTTSASSSVTSSATTSVSTSATTSVSSTVTSSLTSTDSSTVSSTESNTPVTTVTSSATSTASSSVTSSATSSQTTSQTSSATTSQSSSATTSQSSSATTSQSSSATTSQSSSATSTQSTSASSSVTSTASSSVTSSATTSQSSSATTSQSSSATTSQSSSATTSQSSSATTSQSSTVTSTQTASKTSTVTSTASSSVTSSATTSQSSSATTSQSSSATTSQSSSATTSQSSSVTSTQSTSVSSSVTSSVSSTMTSTQSASETTTVTSTATSSFTTTATSSITTTVSSSLTSTDSSTQSSTRSSTPSSTASTTPTTTVTTDIQGRVICGASNKRFLSVHGIKNCNHQADALNGFLKRCKQYDDRYNTDKTLQCNEVIGDFLLGSDSRDNCMKVATVLHHVVEEITEFEGNHGNQFTFSCNMNSIQIIPKQNKETMANCELFATKLNDFIDGIVDGSYEADNCEVTSPTTTPTSTLSTTATSTQSNTGSTTVTTTATTSQSSSATTSVTTSASSSATTSASSSPTTSQSSSPTTSQSSSATTSQSSSATTSQSSSATTSVSTSATSSASTTVTGSETSTASTTATTSATTSASSSATTSQSSSATTSQSSSATTSLSSTATTSLSTTATSTQSNTGSTTQTSTATNTATTATTTPTSTVTSKFFAKLICGAEDNAYLASPNGKLQCEEQADMINEILEDCSEFKSEYRAVDVVCNLQNGEYLLGGTSQDTCNNVSKAMNYAVSEITQFPGALHDVQCKLNNIRIIATDRDGNCTDFVDVMNDIIDKRNQGRFRHCTVSSPSTTQTSTVTSSVSSTVSSSVTSTASSTVSSSVTSSVTSTQSSSITSTVSSTQTSSVTTSGSTTASTSVTSSATSSVSTTISTTVSSTQTSSDSSSVTSTASSSVTSTASSTGSTSLTSTQTSSVSSTESSSVTSTVTSSVSTTVTSTVTTTLSHSPITTVSSTQTSTASSTVSSSITTSGSTTATSSDSSTQTSTASSSFTTTGSSSVTTTRTSSATSTQSTTVSTTVTTTQTTSPTSSVTSTMSTTLTTTVTSTVVSTITSTVVSTVTSTVVSTVTTTDSSTVTTTLSFSRTSTLTSTATSTITTNNERTMETLYFKADAKVVNGAKFKVALATVLIANGVLEKALTDIFLEEGSIIADVHLDGMEYGRMIRELTAVGLIVVVVDGMAFVAYSTYDSIDPYASDNVCTGHTIGNLTFAMDDFGAPSEKIGYASRNDTSLIPSELYAFQTNLESDLQYALTTYYTSNPDFLGEICVTTSVVRTPAHSIYTSIILSNYSANFQGITQADIDGASMAVALGYKAGEIVIDNVRDQDVAPGGVVLDAVDDAFFAEAATKNSSAGLIGGVLGAFIVCAVLFGLIYRHKRKNHDEHTERVKKAISPDGLQFFVDNSSSVDWRMDTNNDGIISHDELTNFGLGLGSASFNSSKVAYTSPSGASMDSPGYFSVGEINSPKYLPGPGDSNGGGHFYPMTGGSLMGVGSGPLFSRSPIMADYGGRTIETASGRQTPRSVPMANPHYRESEDGFLSTRAHAGATKLQEGRPSLVADDEYISTTDVLTSWGGGAAHSPDTLSDSDGDWGQELAWGEPQGDHGFPTLKSATMKVGAGIGLSGYALPQSPVEVSPTVHFAGVATGRPSLMEDDNDDGTANNEYGMAAIALAGATYRPNISESP